MHPILFHIGSFPVYSYGALILLGTAALFVIAMRLGMREGIAWEYLWQTALGVGVGGIFIGRLSHLIVEPARSAEFTNFYAILRPGTPGNIVGIMIGGFIGGTVVRAGLGLPSTGNFFAPALAAASVIWRVGCTLAGCCYGKETDLPWAITVDNVQRHPTMVYEGLFNLVALAVLLWARPKVRKDNGLFYAYLASYALFRFWLEFIRVYPMIALGLTGIQLLCLAILVALGVWLGQQAIKRSSVAMGGAE